MTLPRVRIADVAPARPLNPSEFSDANHVWLLNLDKIVSGSSALPEKHRGPASVAGSSTHGFDTRHVLYSKLRPNLNKVVLPDERGIATTELVPLLPDPSRCDRAYLAHYLRSPRFARWATARTAGAKMPRLNMKEFRDHEIPLPPLPEQRRIAAILDQADALRAKRREAIAKCDQLLQSVFLDMFGDPVTNPKGWPMVRAEEVFGDFLGGKNVACPDESISPYRILKVSAVTSTKYSPAESKPAPPNFSPPPETIVQAGDLLFSRANTTDLVAATAFVWATPANIVLPDKLWKLRRHPDSKADVMYLWELFKNETFRRALAKTSSGTSGSMKNISKSKLRATKIPLPPNELQAEFGRNCRFIHSQGERLNLAAAHSEAIFAALQQRAFSGQLSRAA